MFSQALVGQVQPGIIFDADMLLEENGLITQVLWNDIKIFEIALALHRAGKHYQKGIDHSNPAGDEEEMNTDIQQAHP
ncbi:MAG: hypothetical protein DDT29_02116 [Dehalococcoidia bacterium]|nr:hypothetical protein [Bacillota bacterium]